MPRWRNRQTRWIEGPVSKTCRFNSGYGHQFYAGVAECIRTALRTQRLRDCEFKSRRRYQFEVCFGVAVAKW